VVGVGRNLAKKTVFTADERIELMREACAKYPNVEVRAFDGLQVEFARACGASFVVRGIRALSDFEFEFEMANMNRRLDAGIEMVYLMTAPEYLFVSASRVKELAAFGAPIDNLVPPNVAKRLKAQIGKSNLRTGATEADDYVTVLLAADVGNTNIVLGAYDGAKLVATWRTATRSDQTEDELAVMVDALLGREDLSLDEVDALVLGSVVPALTASFTRLAERYLDRPALVIGPGVKTGVRLRVDNPSEVGADRIANTLAAHRRYGGPAIVVDFGTTTNFDIVSAEGDFLGGAFAPGLEVSA